MSRVLSIPLLKGMPVVVASLLLAGCLGLADQSAEPATRTMAVRVADVVSIDQSSALRFAGVVRARQRASLTFQVGGVLLSRSTEIGQQVAAGDVLAVLYNPELEPARDAARARLSELQTQAAQAVRDHERSRQLFERGVLSAQELEQQKALKERLQAGVVSARASLSQSEQLRAETQLRAPFAGRVEALLVEPGEFVAPGQAVLQIAAEQGHEVEVRVPAALVADLSPGQELAVWSSLDGQQSRGRIVEVGQGASQGGALYPLVVALEQDGLRSGTAVEVELQSLRPVALGVPIAAVMRSGEGLSVFRVSEGRAERVTIAVAALLGEQVLLSESDLVPGDQVVYAGLSRLSDGDALELLP